MCHGESRKAPSEQFGLTGAHIKTNWIPPVCPSVGSGDNTTQTDWVNKSTLRDNLFAFSIMKKVYCIQRIYRNIQ